MEGAAGDSSPSVSTVSRLFSPVLRDGSAGLARLWGQSTVLGVRRLVMGFCSPLRTTYCEQFCSPGIDCLCVRQLSRVSAAQRTPDAMESEPQDSYSSGLFKRLCEMRLPTVEVSPTQVLPASFVYVSAAKCDRG